MDLTSKKHNESRLIDDLRGKLDYHLNNRSKDIFKSAFDRCKKQLDQVDHITREYLNSVGIDLSDVCFVAVGSVGRSEALDASDLDIIPVLRDEGALKVFLEHDQNIRKLLSEKLELKVSKGSDLTQCVTISRLTAKESIGGDTDDSSALTKRILVLTESAQAGGNLPLLDIRKKVLDAYSENERTRGRHVLSLCNDLARYYRTLCIEYIAKVDIQDKDWCTRNLKLRHSRKLWYFSSMIAIASLASTHPDGEENYINGILEAFELVPTLRLFHGVEESQYVFVGRALNRYAWFLGFMSDQKHREALSRIRHTNRYDNSLSNPFPMMKLNSDMMHSDMVDVINNLDSYMRQRIYDWFLL